MLFSRASLFSSDARLPIGGPGHDHLERISTLPAAQLFPVVSRSSSLVHLIVLLVFAAGALAASFPQLTLTNARWCLESLARTEAGSISEWLFPVMATDSQGGTAIPVPPLGMMLSGLLGRFVPVFRINSFFIIPLLSVCGALLIYFALLRRFANFRVAFWATLLSLSNPVVIGLVQTPRPVGLGLVCLMGAFWFLSEKRSSHAWQSYGREFLGGALLGGVALCTPEIAAVMLALLGIVFVIVYRRSRQQGDDFDSAGEIFVRIDLVVMGFAAVALWWFLWDGFSHGFRGTVHSLWSDSIPITSQVSRSGVWLLLFGLAPLSAIGIAAGRRSGSEQKALSGWVFLMLGTVVTIPLAMAGTFGTGASAWPTASLLPLVALLMNFWTSKGIESLSAGHHSDRIGLAIVAGALLCQLLLLDQMETTSRLVRVALPVVITIGIGVFAIWKLLIGKSSRIYRHRLPLAGALLLLLGTHVVIGAEFITHPTDFYAAVRRVNRQVSERNIERVFLVSDDSDAAPLLLGLQARWPSLDVKWVRRWSEVAAVEESVPLPIGTGDASDSVVDPPQTFVLYWGGTGARITPPRVTGSIEEVIRPFYLQVKPVRAFILTPPRADRTVSVTRPTP